MLISAVQKGYRKSVREYVSVCVWDREEVMYIVKHMYGPGKASARWWHLGKELNRKHAENPGKEILVREGWEVQSFGAGAWCLQEVYNSHGFGWFF